MQLMDGHVMTCLAANCSYNCDSECCAPNITVGDEHPMCDMFTTANVDHLEHEPRVNKCMVDECHFNKSAACHAAGITLTSHAEHADCMTYRV